MHTNNSPFGMLQPGRSHCPDEYRFDFNGTEKDDEIKGDMIWLGVQPYRQGFRQQINFSQTQTGRVAYPVCERPEKKPGSIDTLQQA